MIDTSGVIQVRYGFDLYGRTTKLQGSVDSDFQFAGMYMHSRSGMYLTPTRAYNAQIAVWLSRDLADEISYNYASGNPVSLIDPYGLDSVSITGRTDVPGHIGLLIQVGEGKTATYYRFDGAFTGIKIGNRNLFPVGTLISKRSQSCTKPTPPILYADLTKDEAVVRKVLDAAESIHKKVNDAKLSYTLIPYGANMFGDSWPTPVITGTSWQYTSNQVTGTILRSAGLNVPSSVFAPGANLNLPFGP
ncbi:MAG: hypothetical protein K2Y39_01235 [Candidatus Obscuribacterales bacterium]|nr:hypothetical protein [Candidatus Obscuribacterales bacterium]